MPDSPAHTPRRLRLVVLLGGTATMALQMAAVRLLAPAVGASSIVWATIIGLSLLAMSLGYVLGGRLADRRVDGRTLATTLGAAAILVAAAPLVAGIALDTLAVHVDSPSWSDLLGAGLAYAALFLAPAILLGVTPPYAIRLAIPRVEDAGRTAGGLYALSTLGSIIGTLLTALVLVQWIGTRATLWGIAAMLVVAALIARSVQAVHGDSAASVDEDVPARTRAQADAARASDHAAPATLLSVRLAGAIVLVEGMAMMATEMSIARLIAPFFGASHAVWAVIIATVMGSIALGSRLGGRLVDRRPSERTLMWLLGASALAVAILPFVTSPVMRLSTGGIDDVAVGTVIGTFLATMALLVVPVTLLGMVPPTLLRLAVPDVERAGRTAGRLYALSTAGALVGTFASVLWLIPAIGTRRTMLAFALALALIPVLWRIAVRTDPPPRASLALVPLAAVAALLLAPTGLVKPLDDAKVLDERESRYQFIQVVEDTDDGRHLLQLNEGWAVHSIWDPDTVLTGGIWDHFLVVPALRRIPLATPTVDGVEIDPTVRRAAEPRESSTAGSMLVIGSAAGTSKRAFDQLRPSMQMTSVELDTEVTAVGRKYFELEGRVTAADGRPYLDRSDDEWDVIHVDAYRQPYIPFYLTTREFFELVKGHLPDGGVFSINVGSTPSDPRINEAVAATMRDVFPLVARYRAETYNEVIVAVNETGVTIDELRERIRSSDLAVGDSPVYYDQDVQTFAPGNLPLDPDLADERRAMRRLFNDFAGGMVEVEPDPDRVMTDDRAPVEWMTDRMIFGEAG